MIDTLEMHENTAEAIAANEQGQLTVEQQQCIVSERQYQRLLPRGTAGMLFTAGLAVIGLIMTLSLLRQPSLNWIMPVGITVILSACLMRILGFSLPATVRRLRIHQLPTKLAQGAVEMYAWEGPVEFIIQPYWEWVNFNRVYQGKLFAQNAV
jgi:hypothetical protein